MFNRFICQILNIQIWELILGFGSIFISILAMSWRFQRARKKDMDVIMDKKADKEMVNEAFKIRDQKILHVETVIKEYKIDINENIKEIKQMQNTLNNDMKKLQAETNKNFIKILEKL